MLEEIELSPLTKSRQEQDLSPIQGLYFSPRHIVVALSLAAATTMVMLHYFDSARDGIGVMTHSTFNASRDLDFAIIGFPKTGTSFLLEVLGAHPEITMPPKEFCAIHHADGDNELSGWIENQSAYQPYGQKYGIKCPTMIRVTNAIENLMKVSDETRLVVGVRHPVLWFQSFYNYRVYENYQHPELYKDSSPIQSPFGLNNTNHWRECSTAYGKYEIFLKQLAKVSLMQHEMYEMLQSDSLWQKRFSVNPYKVFIYTSDQLSDWNETRQSIFREDLKAFLRLDAPLIDFHSVPRVNANNETHPEYIDICEPKFDVIRKTLLASGRKSRDWILNRFLKSKDVTVSNLEYFRANLHAWGTDPCL